MGSNQRKAGIILAYLTQGITIVTGLIYTPIMIALLGENEYGLYQLVASVVSYMSLLSLGFGNAYNRFYARICCQGSEREVSRLNGMFLTIFLVISGVCLVCGFVMTENIEIIFADGLTAEEYPLAKILMALMMGNMALTFPNSVFESILAAREQFIFQKTLGLLQSILNPFLTFPLLLLGHGSVMMVVVTTALTVAKLITNVFYCMRKLGIQFEFRGFQLKLFQEMWTFTFFIFINLIVDQLNWNVDKYLLGRFAGTKAVTVYGIGAQINTLYLSLSTSVSGVFIPKVNMLVAKERGNGELTKLFAKVGRIQFLILILVLSGFIFFGRPFIQYWAGEEFDASYQIALLLMVPVTVPLMQNLGIEIQRAKNMHQARSLVYLAVAGGNVFVSIPCIRAWGPKGAAIGTALSLFMGNGLFMNWYYHKKIGLDIIWFWKQILKFLPAMLLPVIFGVLLIKNLSFSGWPDLIAWGMVYTIIYVVNMWFLGMNGEEKQTFRRIAKRLEAGGKHDRSNR